MKHAALVILGMVMFFLLSRAAACEEKRSLDIFEAVTSRNVELVKEVLDREPSALTFRRNISFVPGYTPLHLAAWGGDFHMVSFILERGISADIRSQDLMTPLHVAGSNRLDNGYAETIIMLLKYRADINALNIYRQTPLDMALRSGDSSMVSFLKLLGASRGMLFQYMDPVETTP